MQGTVRFLSKSVGVALASLFLASCGNRSEYSMTELCQLEKQPAKKDWALKELQHRLNRDKGSQFVMEYEKFSSFVGDEPDISLLSLYQQVQPGDALDEEKSATFGKVMGEKPGVFFAWQDCSQTAQAIIANPEISCDSPKACAQYAKTLEDYAKSPACRNPALVNKCIEGLRRTVREYK
jgi:hypothetical protein